MKGQAAQGQTDYAKAMAAKTKFDAMLGNLKKAYVRDQGRAAQKHRAGLR